MKSKADRSPYGITITIKIQPASEAALLKREVIDGHFLEYVEAIERRTQKLADEGCLVYREETIKVFAADTRKLVFQATSIRDPLDGDSESDR